jgi:hypothetical protein
VWRHDRRLVERRFPQVGPTARANSASSRAPFRHGSPWPHRTVPAPVEAMASSERRLRSESAVAAPVTICGPRLAMYGLNVTTASPAISVSRSGKYSEQCPRVWPGVKRTRGDPGTGRVPFPVAFYMPHRRRQERARADQAPYHRQGLGIPDDVTEPAPLMSVLLRMARERRVVLVAEDRHRQSGPRPLREADVVEMRMGEHDRVDRLRRLVELAKRGMQASPRGRNPTVDDRQPVAVFDEIPVRVGILDPVDPRRHIPREHLPELPGPSRCNHRPGATGPASRQLTIGSTRWGTTKVS